MRDKIQKCLNIINELECGPEVSDDLLEEKKNYFNYSISETFMSENHDRKNVNRISLTGYLKRKKNHMENTPSILDKKTDEIIFELKQLNFRCSSDDVSVNDNISKIKITGFAYYSEVNKELF